MSVWRPSRLLSVFLVPALLAFSIQASLEVVHPIEEEQLRPTHDHVTDGSVFDDGALCGGAVHPTHYCAHSNAFAHLEESPIAFGSRIARNPEILIPGSPDVRRLGHVFGRAPPAFS